MINFIELNWTLYPHCSPLDGGHATSKTFILKPVTMETGLHISKGKENMAESTKGPTLGDSCIEGKKPRCASKRLHDQKRSKTRINIGSAFPRWRELLLKKRMKLDAELATFLLDRYGNYYLCNCCTV